MRKASTIIPGYGPAPRGAITCRECKHSAFCETKEGKRTRIRCFNFEQKPGVGFKMTCPEAEAEAAVGE